MLAHKANGENHLTFSVLLLAAHILERWTEVRVPVIPKNPPLVIQM